MFLIFILEHNLLFIPYLVLLFMAEYEAFYGIDGGVSYGFGTKYPDYTEEKMNIQAADDACALRNAMDLAGTLADDSLSNPDTGVTKVSLLSLLGPHGNVQFDKESAVVTRSLQDHILRFKSES
jgi:hypothetical protein